MTEPLLMDGKAVAAQMLKATAARVEAIIQKAGAQPCLATVLVGENPASATYVRMKVKRCEAVGMRSLRVDLPEPTTTAQLVEQVRRLSDDPAVHGILLQHPVPPQIDERAGFEAIRPIKDVDGVTSASFASVSFPGEGLTGYGSCTPAGMMRLLDHYEVSLKGVNAAVIGRSAILGKPLAMMLLARHATVTVCHSRTPPDELRRICAAADVVCACVGRPEFVRGEWLKPGCIVLDAGYNEGNVGDCHYPSCAQKARLITPVPGGVGPMTIATLIEQTAQAAEKQLGLDLG